MVRTAKASRAGSAESYVLLRKGIDLMSLVGDAAAGGAAIDQLNEQFEIDSIAEKVQLLDKVYIAPLSTSAEGSKQLALAATQMANEAADADRYGEAIAALKLANNAARRVANHEISRLALDRRRDVEKLSKQYEAVKQAHEVLAKDPDDANANLYTGRWSAFVHGDWKKGLPLLAKGNNELLKSLASDELADPQQPAAQAELADRWWELSLKAEGTMRDEIRKHAVEWYQKALPNLAGLSAQAARQRIDEFNAVDKPHATEPKAGEVQD
jgi:hypothetical protein